MPDFLIALLASLAVTIVLLPFARRAGDAWSLHAYPSSDRWHTLPIPNTGGIACSLRSSWPRRSCSRSD
jgi:UDP-N-acetylmuramyl pentapeptide phosphotransferase/UDP-N-acetylglucosamine-1-phosphate transferase